MKAKLFNLSAIDLAKFIFAILVVGIHTSPFEDYSEFGNFVFVDIIAGLAVPFFFMASCYFFFSKLIFENGKIKKCKENFGRFKKYFIRILLLYVLWSAVYLLWQIPEWISTGWFSVAAFVDYFKAALVSKTYYHLWYILSLLYVIPIMYFLLRHINTKVFAGIMAAVYIFGVLFYTYGRQYAPDILIKIWDFVPTSVVSVLLIMPSVTPCLFVDKIKLKQSVNLLLFIAFYILFVIESILVYLYTERTANSQYAFLIVPTIFFMFTWLKNCNLNISKETSTMLRNMSSVIYFVHPMVMNLFGLVVAKESVQDIVYFVLIAVLSALVGFVLSFINSKAKKVKILNYFM